MASSFSRHQQLCLLVVVLIGCGKAPVSDEPSQAARRLAKYIPPSERTPSESSEPLLGEVYGPSRFTSVATRPQELEIEEQIPPAPIRRAAPKPTHRVHRLLLGPGRALDLMNTFRFDLFTVETALDEQNRVRNVHWTNVELTYPGGEPFLVFGRRGAQLHGVAVAFYESGSPMTYVTYESGHRHGNFMTWDESQQPVYFAQYNRGEKDGVCCFYNKCSSECRDSHLLLVQEWDDGETWKSHLISDNEVALSLRHGIDYKQEDDLPELTAALEAMEEFEGEMLETELQVKDWLLTVQRQIAERIKLERRKRIVQAARQRRSRGLALAAGIGFGGGGGGGARFGGS